MNKIISGKIFHKLISVPNIQNKLINRDLTKNKRLIILFAVSGAGKSTAMKQFKKPPFAIVELDDVLKTLYTQLQVGDSNKNWYIHSVWKDFLKKYKNEPEVIASFRQEILSKTAKNYKSLIIGGNHFSIPEIEEVVVKALTINQTFILSKKLFLDIEPEIIFTQRKKRNNKSDREASVVLDQIENLVSTYRNRLPQRGYESVSYNELVNNLEKEYTIADRIITILYKKFKLPKSTLINLYKKYLIL